MHELSVTEGILKIALEEAEKHNAKKINNIRVKMWEMSGLLPDCINYYFAIVSKDSIAADAVLEVEKLPVKIHCNNCNNCSRIAVRSFRCPVCGSQDLKVVQGN